MLPWKKTMEGSMNILQRLYPGVYTHLELRSKREFKGMLTALLDIDEYRSIYRINFGLRSGDLFEKYAYMDLSDFDIPNVDVVIEMIKQKLEQIGKNEVLNR
jgi:hypothetical protein